jgi:ssDNA-binding Zn-finger/Zn-ribbon topoisomerase 1
MAYLNCPKCGLTMFDRNPLTSPRHCPRCARRRGVSIELERKSSVEGGAAASLLGGILRRDVKGEPRDRAGDVQTS